ARLLRAGMPKKAGATTKASSRVKARARNQRGHFLP
ncbi:C15orf40 isoform 4, partial [Pongo abelii]